MRSRTARDTAIGTRVLLVRRQRGLTQMETASLANISIGVLSRLETGRQSVYAERLRDIARALHVSADYLLAIDAPALDREAGLPDLPASRYILL